MRTIELKRIGMLSAVIRGCIVCSAAGFVLGLIVAFWAAMLASSFTLATGVDVTGAGFAMLVLAPLFGMLVFGTAGTGIIFLLVFLYNLTAGLFGGVLIDIVDGQGLTSPDDRNQNIGVHHSDDQSPPPPVVYPI